MPLNYLILRVEIRIPLGWLKRLNILRFSLTPRAGAVPPLQLPDTLKMAMMPWVGGLSCSSHPPWRHLSPQAPARSRDTTQGAVTAPRMFLLKGLFSPRHPRPLRLYPAGSQRQPCAASTILRGLLWRQSPAGTHTKSREPHHCAMLLP